jgi:flagellar motor switch/type III secretory pathway protein FliN
MSVHHWLPKDAFVGRAAKDVLSGPVADWSARWIARAPAAVSRLRLVEGGLARRDQSISGEHVELEMPGSGKRCLLEALLDVDLTEHQRSEGDMRVLDALADVVCKDLIRTFEAIVAGHAVDEAGGRLKLTLTIGRNDICEATLPASSMVPLLKRQFGNATNDRPLSRLSAALRHVHVSTRVVLGDVELSLNEVRELGVGDVVVVDRAVGDPVDLRLPSSTRPLARGKLGRNGNQISIQL